MKICKFEIDKRDNDFASFSIEEGDNRVSFLLRGIDNIWEVVSFISGRINGTRYRKDRYNDKLYEKDGRGRVSKETAEEMRNFYGSAMNIIEEFLANNYEEDRYKDITFKLKYCPRCGELAKDSIDSTFISYNGICEECEIKEMQEDKKNNSEKYQINKQEYDELPF